LSASSNRPRDGTASPRRPWTPEAHGAPPDPTLARRGTQSSAFSAAEKRPCALTTVRHALMFTDSTPSRPAFEITHLPTFTDMTAPDDVPDLDNPRDEAGRILCPICRAPITGREPILRVGDTALHFRCHERNGEPASDRTTSS